MIAMAVATAGALAQEPAPPSGGASANGAGSANGASGAASGASVSAIQRALGLPVDGVYGRRTRAAVRRFQRREGLTVDGIAGPATLAALGLSGGDGGGDSGGGDAGGGDSGGGDETDSAGATGTQPVDTTGSGSTDPSTSATLERIAQCESGGNPTAISADGQYRGKYQFDQATWERIGGTGDPAQASEAEQDRLAAKLFAERGTAPWPVCGAGG